MDAALLAASIDHTLLRADATPAEILRLCAEACEHRFAAVCVNGVHVARCAERLRGTAVSVACTIGFPLGAMAREAKLAEARTALDHGASELDVVLQIGLLKSGDDASVLAELAEVCSLARAGGARVKAILETGALSEAEVLRACALAREARADFVKTSTGFGPRGATVEDVRLLRRAVGGALGVKAAGGIRTAAQARSLLAAGASRLGTSSGVALLAEA